MASILKVDTIQDQDGNNIINESGDTITIGASGDTITVPTGASLTVPNGGLSGQNYPAFEAYLSADQSVSDAVLTVIEFDTEVLDTDSCYNNTTYRFTPTVAGKYFVYVAASGNTDTSNLKDVLLRLRKNAVDYKESFLSFNLEEGQDITLNINAIVDMNGSTDFVDVRARVNSIGSPSVRQFIAGIKKCYFGAYRIGD